MDEKEAVVKQFMTPFDYKNQSYEARITLQNTSNPYLMVVIDPLEAPNAKTAAMLRCEFSTELKKYNLTESANPQTFANPQDQSPNARYYRIGSDSPLSAPAAREILEKVTAAVHEMVDRILENEPTPNVEEAKVSALDRYYTAHPN